MSREVIIACDFKDKETLFNFLDNFKDEKPYLKIGMEIFYKEGLELVKEIKKRGHKIFLDLKLCDIPNTVYKAMLNLADAGVDMVNVHAFGGIEMMKAAKKALIEKNADTKLLAVTILTSLNDEALKNELLISEKLGDTVIHYAKNAKEAGCDGVVCSPLESTIVKQNCGEDFLTVTPGVRFADDDKGDQKRVTTPSKARELGSSYIVVGRSITGANDPKEAYLRASREFRGE